MDEVLVTDKAARIEAVRGEGGHDSRGINAGRRLVREQELVEARGRGVPCDAAFLAKFHQLKGLAMGIAYIWNTKNGWAC